MVTQATYGIILLNKQMHKVEFRVDFLKSKLNVYMQIQQADK